MAARPMILVAAPATVFNKLQGAFADRADLMNAETFDTAAQLLREPRLELFLLCYVFDDVRPYRILNHLGAQDLPEVTTVLVRALPVPLRESEKDVEEAYRQLGVSLFVNLSDDERLHGHPAVERFAERMLTLISAARRRAGPAAALG